MHAPDFIAMPILSIFYFVNLLSDYSECGGAIAVFIKSKKQGMPDVNSSNQSTPNIFLTIVV
jgi:hypothetical protein